MSKSISSGTETAGSQPGSGRWAPLPYNLRGKAHGLEPQSRCSSRGILHGVWEGKALQKAGQTLQSCFLVPTNTCTAPNLLQGWFLLD